MALCCLIDSFSASSYSWLPTEAALLVCRLNNW